MEREIIGHHVVGGQDFSLYRTWLRDGRERYLAEAAFEDGEMVLLDHWNLAALRTVIQELMPVMTMARKIH
jgi:hypothetical protein